MAIATSAVTVTASLEATQFLTLPRDNLEFHEFVNQLSAKGGGDEPESGLEALTPDIRFHWERDLDAIAGSV